MCGRPFPSVPAVISVEHRVSKDTNGVALGSGCIEEYRTSARLFPSGLPVRLMLNRPDLPGRFLDLQDCCQLAGDWFHHCQGQFLPKLLGQACPAQPLFVPKASFCSLSVTFNASGPSPPQGVTTKGRNEYPCLRHLSR